MEIKVGDKVFHINKKKNHEYEKLFDFSGYDFKHNWFSSILHITDEEIYVLCNHFLFRYIQNKSKGRTDWQEIQAWNIDRERKMSKKIMKGQIPRKFSDVLFLLGNISSSIIIRSQIPKIIKYKTIFGSFKDLLKLNRILFDRANHLLELRNNNE